METSMIRQKARENLTNNWGLSIGVAAVACLLGGLMVGASFIPEVRYSWNLRYPEWNRLFEDFRINFGGFRISFGQSVLGFASFILGGVLQLGYARFLLKQHDGRSPEFNDLFSQFDRFGAGFAQAFLRSLYSFLWMLLLIVPGIIASLSYAMTPFILEENPGLTASEAISRSKQLMDGHKMDLFILRLTFLGWDILCILTLNLGHIALNPYKNAAEAVFYRQITTQKRYEI